MSYTPTSIEKEVTLARGDFLKLSGDGIFATQQGEGVTAGRESVFLRLQNCNLACGKDDQGWSCDTWYTWDKATPEYWRETSNVGVQEVVDKIEECWDVNFGKVLLPNLVITGGEPLLQQGKIIALLSMLPGWDIEIETNGTVAPKPELTSCQINCSPKLSSSGNSLAQRRKIDVLKRIAKMPNYWLKFVITDEQFTSDIEEVQELVHISDAQDERVLLMPEGSDPDKLSRLFERLMPVAENFGYSVVQRNHVFWYGNKRRT